MAAQAGLCLAWSETVEDKFCRVVAQLFIDHFFFWGGSGVAIKVAKSLTDFRSWIWDLNEGVGMYCWRKIVVGEALMCHKVFTYTIICRISVNIAICSEWHKTLASFLVFSTFVGSLQSSNISRYIPRIGWFQNVSECILSESDA